MSLKDVETLNKMNAGTAKHAQWIVRILDPKVTEYKFTARGQEVAAAKFSCILVSKNPAQYMLATVPFSFQDRTAAAQAKLSFLANTSWELKAPNFDTKQKQEYNSCPVKVVVNLSRPTKTKAIPPTSPEMQQYASQFVDVGANLSQIMTRLEGMNFANKGTGPASGSTKPATRCLDVCGKIKSLSAQKPVSKGGKNFMVGNMELVDNTGSLVEVNVWDSTHSFVKDIPLGEGVTFVGLTATKDPGDTAVKLNLWDSAHVLRGGPRAQSLTSLSMDGQNFNTLTAIFSPSAPSINVDGEAHSTCVAAFAAATAACAQDKVVQMPRCIFEAPLQEEGIFTQDKKRLYVSCRMHDWTGGGDVVVLEDAALALYGCVDKEAVKEALDQGTLAVQVQRFTARGLLRTDEKGILKKYIAKISPSPLEVKISAGAMRLALGLADLDGDVVQACPVERVGDASMLGLAVRSDVKGWISAHRVLLLVQGTCESQLDPVGEAKGLKDQSYRVTSNKVRCLLSETESLIDLHGYCDFGNMLTYRLDKDVALVVVSAVEAAVEVPSPDTPAFLGPVSDRLVASVEHMQKISEPQKLSLLQSLAVEWRTALTNDAAAAVGSYESPLKREYWEQPASKLRRLESEAPSPARVGSTAAE
jgi:hypothetical protein